MIAHNSIEKAEEQPTIPKTRNTYSANFKARVALEAIKNDGTTEELSAKYEIHPSLIIRWQSEFQRATDEGALDWIFAETEEGE